MSRRAAPHDRAKLERRVLSPDQRWAGEIREHILEDSHPFQHDAIEDPSRRVSILAGRGAAKTTAKRCRAAIKATSIRGAQIVYFATTKPQAKIIYWDKLQEMNEHYGLELRFKESDQTATCARTGGVITMTGMEDDSDIERWRGTALNEVQVDEAASHDHARVERLIDRIVGPRLGERNGCVVLGGTPGHILKGEFYDATRPGSPHHSPYADRGKPGYERRYWSSHHWTAKMVYELPDAARRYPAIVANWIEALKEKAEKQWSDDNPIWLREYLAQWASDETNMVFRYRPFDADGVTPWNQWDPFGDYKLEGIQQLDAAIKALHAMGYQDLRFVYGGDMGSALPYALNIFAFSPKDPKRRIWHVMAFERTRMYARPIAELHMGPAATERALRSEPSEPHDGALGLTGWPDGAVMDSDQATIDELSNTYGLTYKKAERNPHYKRGAIELVNGDLVDGRIQVIKGSPLEQQLQSVQWRENRFGHVEEDQRQASHSTDTLVYSRKLIAGLFEAGVVEQEATSTPQGHRPPARHDDPHAGISSQSQSGGLHVPLHYRDPWGNL